MRVAVLAGAAAAGAFSLSLGLGLGAVANPIGPRPRPRPDPLLPRIHAPPPLVPAVRANTASTSTSTNASSVPATSSPAPWSALNASVPAVPPAGSGLGSGSEGGSSAQVGDASGSGHGAGSASASASDASDQDDAPFMWPQVWNASVYAMHLYTEGGTVPGARPQDADNQTAITAYGGSDDMSQAPHCPTVFIGNAVNDGSFDTGWSSLPNVLGFDLMRDVRVATPDEDNATLTSSDQADPEYDSWSDDSSDAAASVAAKGAVFPYYIEHGKNTPLIKRAIIALPGVPRNSWQTVNEVRNSMICTGYLNTADFDLSEVLLLAPVWLTQDDINAGAGGPEDIFWPSGNNWGSGQPSSGPGNVSISAFSALDALVRMLWDDANFPALDSVVVAGHSLGGALAQRYASIRAPTGDDENMIYFAANPSTYTWPSPKRPRTHVAGGCNSTRNEWPFGYDLTAANLSLAYDPIPSTARTDRPAVERALRAQYLGRQVHFACGLADNETGATQCQAEWQGTSHLTRCRHLQTQVAGFNTSTNQTWDYIPGVAHNEYLMFSSEQAQQRLFIDTLDVRMSAPQSTKSKSGTGLTGNVSTLSSSLLTAPTSTAASPVPAASSASSAATAHPGQAAVALLALLVAMSVVTVW